VLREYLVDERLIADTSTARLLAERLEDTRLQANGDELTRLLPDWRPAHTARPPIAAASSLEYPRSQLFAVYAARSRRLARQAMMIRIASALPLLLSVYATIAPPSS
jgi:hypothetical protein